MKKRIKNKLLKQGLCLTTAATLASCGVNAAKYGNNDYERFDDEINYKKRISELKEFEKKGDERIMARAKNLTNLTSKQAHGLYMHEKNREAKNNNKRSLIKIRAAYDKNKVTLNKLKTKQAGLEMKLSNNERHIRKIESLDGYPALRKKEILNRYAIRQAALKNDLDATNAKIIEFKNRQQDLNNRIEEFEKSLIS